MNYRLLALMAMAGIDPSAAVALVDDAPPPLPHPPLPPEIVRVGKVTPHESSAPRARVTALGQTYVVVGSTRAQRRKGMARTSPQVLAKREARRRQKRARAAGRAR